MTAIKEVEIVRKKITAYIRQLNKLEEEMARAKQETIEAKKSLSDRENEVDALQKRIKDIVQENENFREAVKHFKELGEKDKREMDKMNAKIEQLQAQQ